MRFFDSVTRSALVAAVMAMGVWTGMTVEADETASDEPVRRTRETVESLDDIFKQTIVMITDKYVHDESGYSSMRFSTVSSSVSPVRSIAATWPSGSKITVNGIDTKPKRWAVSFATRAVADDGLR